jgi:hypothetical protein
LHIKTVSDLDMTLGVTLVWLQDLPQDVLATVHHVTVFMYCLKLLCVVYVLVILSPQFRYTSMNECRNE